MLEIRSNKFIAELVDKYINEKEFKEEELIDCYCWCKNRFIACFNSEGNCFLEEYENVKDLFEDCNEFDEEHSKVLDNIHHRALKLVLKNWILKCPNEETGLTTFQLVLSDEEVTIVETAKQLLEKEVK